MALSASQQALLLFKKLMGKSSTGLSRDFFEEGFSSRPTVLASQIWNKSNAIPNTAPASSTGVVQKVDDLVLAAVSGLSNSFQHDSLKDAIPFNYGDGTSYNYTLKNSANAVIPFGQNDWVVDPDAGTVTFYNGVPASMPPKISFFKYVGTKGAGSGAGGDNKQEVPSGAVDGVNLTYTLSQTPLTSAGVKLTVNGLLYRQGAGLDYTISGSTITILGSPLETGQQPYVVYSYEVP